MLVKYLSSSLRTLAVTYTFQNLNAKLNMVVNDKVRTDYDIKGPIWEYVYMLLIGLTLK